MSNIKNKAATIGAVAIFAVMPLIAVAAANPDQGALPKKSEGAIAAQDDVKHPGNGIPKPSIDSDGDGKADAWDRDDNGMPDAWDVDGDGYPDMLDENGDGRPDKEVGGKPATSRPVPDHKNSD